MSHATESDLPSQPEEVEESSQDQLRHRVIVRELTLVRPERFPDAVKIAVLTAVTTLMAENVTLSDDDRLIPAFPLTGVQLQTEEETGHELIHFFSLLDLVQVDPETTQLRCPGCTPVLPEDISDVPVFMTLKVVRDGDSQPNTDEIATEQLKQYYEALMPSAVPLLRPILHLPYTVSAMLDGVDCPPDYPSEYTFTTMRVNLDTPGVFEAIFAHADNYDVHLTIHLKKLIDQIVRINDAVYTAINGPVGEVDADSLESELPSEDIEDSGDEHEDV